MGLLARLVEPVWVGALTALSALVIFGLSGVVLKLHVTGAAGRIEDWHKVGMGAVVCSILSAFFAFVIGAWVAGKIGGFRRSEPAMLHGAITWLVAVPLLLVAAVLGGASYMGSWYTGLGGTPAWSTTAAGPTTPVVTAAPDSDAARAAEEHAARVARTARWPPLPRLLMGLVGSILGGWLASGEPMTLTHHLRRHEWASRQQTQTGTERVNV